MMGKPTGKYNGTTPQHVRAAKQLEERGEEIKAGEMIAYVKTKSPPYVKPAKLARPDDIDADKYIEYAQSMFDQLLDALDFSFDEIMGATTLDSFWSS
jgi:DNA polymerase I